MMNFLSNALVAAAVAAVVRHIGGADHIAFIAGVGIYMLLRIEDAINRIK